MAQNFSSKIIIKGQKNLLEAYRNALDPESNFKSERGSYTLKLDKNLTISIRADDASAFRALSNNITGFIALVDKAASIAQSKPL